MLTQTLTVNQGWHDPHSRSDPGKKNKEQQFRASIWLHMLAMQMLDNARVQPGRHLDPVKHCWVGSTSPEGGKVFGNTF